MCFLKYLFHNLFSQTLIGGFYLFSLDFLIIKKIVDSVVHFSTLVRTVSRDKIAE